MSAGEKTIAGARRGKRPQLSVEELHQLKWLLGGGLTLLAVWTVLYMDVEAWTLMAVTTVTTGAALVWPRWPARVPALARQRQPCRPRFRLPAPPEPRPALRPPAPASRRPSSIGP
jgi:hypothetical protein